MDDRFPRPFRHHPTAAWDHLLIHCESLIVLTLLGYNANSELFLLSISSSQVIMFLIYENLVIRNATPEDAPLLSQWWNNGSVMAHAGFPNGLHTTSEEISQSLMLDSDETYRRLIIEVHTIPVGEMNYRNMGNSTAEIGIKICDHSMQGKGYGTLFLKLLLSSLFASGYQKIILDTNLNNIRAQHVYESLGFQKLRTNYNSWTNQLGELQSSVDYELLKSQCTFILID